MENGYVIYASYGEYDDYTEIPMFFCPTKMEAELFVEAFENKEQPYWQKINKFFRKWYGHENNPCISDEDINEFYIPGDLSFGIKDVEVLTLMEKHPAT